MCFAWKNIEKLLKTWTKSIRSTLKLLLLLSSDTEAEPKREKSKHDKSWRFPGKKQLWIFESKWFISRFADKTTTLEN